MKKRKKKKEEQQYKEHLGNCTLKTRYFYWSTYSNKTIQIKKKKNWQEKLQRKLDTQPIAQQQHLKQPPLCHQSTNGYICNHTSQIQVQQGNQTPSMKIKPNQKIAENNDVKKQQKKLGQPG